MKTLEQYKTIEDLEQAVNKLAKSKQKTALELKEVKSELGAAECETRENKAKSDVTMQQIASELLTTKQALQETRTRERQVSMREQSAMVDLEEGSTALSSFFLQLWKHFTRETLKKR